MSYDLYFWRFADEAANPPGKDEAYAGICRTLASGETPESIMSLPVDEVRSAIGKKLAADGWSGEAQFWDRNGAVIEFHSDERHVSISMRGKWLGDDANTLIDIMKEYGCPLYDPKIGERFAL